MSNLQTFQANTMAEAIEKVKRRFGRDAVILHTRTFKSGGLLGVGGRTLVEITAACQTSHLPHPRRNTSMAKRSGEFVPRAYGKLDTRQGRAEGAATTMTGAPTSLAEPTGEKLLEELRGLRATIDDLSRHTRQGNRSALPHGLADAYVKLVERHVAEDIAGQLVERVRGHLGDDKTPNPGTVNEYLSRFVESMLPVGGPIRTSRTAKPTVIALVGPTGVGKTTTIAKLAANFSLREGRRVGLITIDTFRIAAVEQLRTYAQIIDVPLEVVAAADQMRRALQTMQDRDIVLIDTTGRSQNDRVRLNELKGFLDQAKPHEVHLVLSSTCSQGVLLDTIEQYRNLNTSRVIFTKLDEAIGFGAILTCLHKAQARLSYVTTGQDVPDDIEVGHGQRLAGLIVRGTRLATG